MDLHDEQLPDGLDPVVERLRACRADPSELEVDQLKQRILARAATSRTKGISMRSRVIAVLVGVGLVAGGTGGVLAAGGGAGGNQSASQSQYKPGCGPKKTDGVNPSGTHTGPPGNPDKQCPPPKPTPTPKPKPKPK